METLFSDFKLWGLLLFGLLAAGANVVGGIVLVKSGAHRLGERFLKYLVALDAGFMLAAIFIEILPETIGIWVGPLHGEGAAHALQAGDGERARLCGAAARGARCSRLGGRVAGN